MSSASHLDRFAHERYLIRTKFFKILGEAFHVYDDAGEVVLYSKMKAFKLKEDIRLYTGEDMQTELLTISARSVMDLGATYDVVDSVAGIKVGALRRKFMKSLLRDEWHILDVNDQEVGTIREDSTLKALARRFIDFAALLLPQHYSVAMDGRPVASFRQQFNPIVKKLEVDFSPDAGARLDRRLGLAAAVLLCAIEGRQG